MPLILESMFLMLSNSPNDLQTSEVNSLKFDSPKMSQTNCLLTKMISFDEESSKFLCKNGNCAIILYFKSLP